MNLWNKLQPVREDVSVFLKKEIKEAVSQRLNEDQTKCANCSTKFLDNEKYCYRCGERKIYTRTDNSVYQLFKEFINEVFHFENRLLLTCIWLFRPGMLSRAYYLGIRNKLLKPISVLALTFGSVYFFFPKVSLFHSSISEISAAYQNRSYSTSNIYYFNIDKYLQEKSQKINKSVSDIVHDVEDRSYSLSQNLFWIIWPMWAYCIYRLLKKYHYRFSYHLVFSATLYSAYLLLWLFIGMIAFHGFNISVIKSEHTLAINLFFLLFTGLSIKTAYRINITAAMLYGILVSVIFFLIIILFRQNITVIPLMLMDR